MERDRHPGNTRRRGHVRKRASFIDAAGTEADRHYREWKRQTDQGKRRSDIGGAALVGVAIGDEVSFVTHQGLNTLDSEELEIS